MGITWRSGCRGGAVAHPKRARRCVGCCLKSAPSDGDFLFRLSAGGFPQTGRAVTWSLHRSYVLGGCLHHFRSPPCSGVVLISLHVSPLQPNWASACRSRQVDRNWVRRGLVGAPKIWAGVPCSSTRPSATLTTLLCPPVTQPVDPSAHAAAMSFFGACIVLGIKANTFACMMHPFGAWRTPYTQA